MGSALTEDNIGGRGEGFHGSARGVAEVADKLGRDELEGIFLLLDSRRLACSAGGRRGGGRGGRGIFARRNISARSSNSPLMCSMLPPDESLAMLAMLLGGEATLILRTRSGAVCLVVMIRGSVSSVSTVMPSSGGGSPPKARGYSWSSRAITTICPLSRSFWACVLNSSRFTNFAPLQQSQTEKLGQQVSPRYYLGPHDSRLHVLPCVWEKGAPRHQRGSDHVLREDAMGLLGVGVHAPRAKRQERNKSGAQRAMEGDLSLFAHLVTTSTQWATGGMLLKHI